jgi:DNA-repair protein XRCC3
MSSSFSSRAPDLNSVPPEQILELSLSAIQEKCGLSLKACRRIKDEAAAKVCPLKLVPVSQLQPFTKLTTGCSKIDALLGGGICTKGINELSGASSCGKSQFCLQICLTAQWPKHLGGLDAGTLYICTEGKFPIKRLHQMASSVATREDLPKDLQEIPYTDNVFVRQVTEKEDLTKCLTESCMLMAARPVRLIIIDSIAGVFRTDLEAGAGERAKSLRAVVKQLEALSERFDAAVLCVNQVSDSMNAEGSNQQVPALGLSWANLLRTRLWMSRTNEARFLEIRLSPEVPSGIKLQFTIANSGIKAV